MYGHGHWKDSYCTVTVQIGHTVFNRDVFVVDIFESAGLFYFKRYLL